MELSYLEDFQLRLVCHYINQMLRIFLLVLHQRTTWMEELHISSRKEICYMNTFSSNKQKLLTLPEGILTLPEGIIHRSSCAIMTDAERLTQRCKICRIFQKYTNGRNVINLDHGKACTLRLAPLI